MPRDTTGQLVEREFLTLPVWDQLDAVTCEGVAQAVERGLPDPWRFQTLERHASGGQERHVAFFGWNEFTFALLPAAEVRLGYDPAHPPAVPEPIVAAWRAEWAEYEQQEPVQWPACLTGRLSPPRTASLAPFLIETVGRPRVAATGPEERERISKDGMRLPTADEWEYACSAGTRTLWHWGDDPRGQDDRANAFGLTIVMDSYELEPLSDRNDFRGGDGGVSVCGGSGLLEHGLALSSWQIYYGHPRTENDWDYTRYRRVFPLPAALFG